MVELRCAQLFVSLFVIHVFSLNEVSGAKNMKKTTGQGISYANFVRDPFHYLNATKICSSLVHVDACNVDCGAACLSDPSCVSFNVAARPDIHGHLPCEILATDKYNSSDQFQQNQEFHHYSIYVSFFSAIIWRDFSPPLSEDRCFRVHCMPSCI